MDKTEKATPQKKNKAKKKGDKIKLAAFSSNLSTISIGAALFFYVDLNFSQLNEHDIFSASTFNQFIELFVSIVMCLVISPLVLLVVDIAINKGLLLKMNVVQMPNPVKNANYFNKNKMSSWFLNLFSTIVFMLSVFCFLLFNDFSFPTLFASYQYWFTALISIYIICCFFVFIIENVLQRVLFESNNKMSKHEVKKESEDDNGKPIVKSHIRGVQQALLSDEEVKNLKSSDVVVLNPVHIVVAIRYCPKLHPVPFISFVGSDLKAEFARKIVFDNKLNYFVNVKIAREMSKYKVGSSLPSQYYNYFLTNRK